MAEKEKEYTVKEIAEKERKSEQTIYRWIAEGHLPCSKYPGRNGSIAISETQYQEFKSLCKVRGESR
ncbi:helix-turn-helix domain-containing protein [Geovibrio ferrireducens]|uniref:helix-turn-helix domain-containing protein n=1 Tax=Geovibrio ferrireducens TaxID=46201 RepID=UPI002245EE88|nr:helix-turn-helix domain-containing protein [Geovibrio ferrireducens]